MTVRLSTWRSDCYWLLCGLAAIFGAGVLIPLSAALMAFENNQNRERQ